MGIQEVYEFLQEQYLQNPTRFFSVRDISQSIDIGEASVSVNLKKMRKHKQVEYTTMKMHMGRGEKMVYRHIQN